MKSRVIQDDPDDDRPPRPVEAPPAEAGRTRRGVLTRVLTWFRRRS